VLRTEALTMTKERILMLAGIGILAVVAVLGWTRQGGTMPQAALVDTSEPAVDVPSYADRPSIRAISPATGPAYAPEPQDYGDRRDGYSTRVVTRERPRSRSLEIVGGSAGAGAAIGAIAGGGRGAAIGALSGGATGLTYDRLTHKQQVVVQQ
jgi:hypothetical protein